MLTTTDFWDRRKGERGIVLVVVVLMFSALALLAGLVFVVATTDLRITAHFKRAADALYAAEAGVRYVCMRIEQELAAGTLTLTNPVETVNYAAPTGLTFETVTELSRIFPTDHYYFRTVGRALHSKNTLEATFRRASVFEMALFGDDSVDLKAYGNIYTFDSAVTPNPTSSDSCGGALVGSNGELATGQDTYIDGSFVLGEDAAGTPGSWKETPQGGSIISGEPAVPSEWIDPDPLGAIGGALAQEFIYYSVATSNDNWSAAPAITPPQNSIRLGNGETMTLSYGNYYVSEIVLNNGAQLDIDSASGPVKIYLTGKLEAKTGSTINFNGLAANFSIFSNSTAPVTLKHNGSFRGLLYAPYADVTIMNTADLYGIVRGKTLSVKNSGDIYLDVSLMRKYPSNQILLLAWKDVRE